MEAPALMYVAGHKEYSTTMYIHLANTSANGRLRDPFEIQSATGGDNSGDREMKADKGLFTLPLSAFIFYGLW
jgi:hypothetical protein